MEQDFSNKLNSKRSAKLYQITIAILILVILVLSWQLWSVKTGMEKTVTIKINENQELKAELDSMLFIHESTKMEYGELALQMTEKDSVILANAEEIKRLIASQADYRQIKRKLDLLRGVTQGYVRQIDSLFTVNQVLKEENIRITGQYKAEQGKTQSLIRDKEGLTEKVEIASMMKAYNLVTKGERLRGRKNRPEETDKAKYIDRLKICFTLSQNLLSNAGEKTIYIRITRPDNVVLVRGKSDLYTFMFNGEQLQFSLKKVIDYQNKEMDICMFWEKENPNEPAMIGTYNIAIFVDGYEIGQSNITLK